MATIRFASDMYVYAPDKQQTIELPIIPPQTLRQVLKKLGLTGSEIGFIIYNKEMLNINRDLDILVNDYDVIDLYPFIGGG